MRRTVSPGWASFLISILLGLVPGGHRALPPGSERAVSAAEQSKAPLDRHQPGQRELKLSTQPARHGWPLETFLPGAAPLAPFRLLVLTIATDPVASPIRLKRIAFPYPTTGPPATAV